MTCVRSRGEGCVVAGRKTDICSLVRVGVDAMSLDTVSNTCEIQQVFFFFSLLSKKQLLRCQMISTREVIMIIAWLHLGAED